MQVKSNIEQWSIVLILLIGACFRIFPLFDAHYLYDEFTASVVRTDYPSFSEMIQGAVLTDFHPPGTHIFLYYWTQLVGTDAWIVKLPFVLAGISSIYLIYLIGKRWFTWQTGIFTAAIFATTEYSISYAIMARPYALGLFFCLLLFWTLTVIIQDYNRRSYLYWILFIFAGLGAASMHYVSMLTAGLTGIIGLFIVPKELRWKLILSGIIIGLLFLPQVSIVTHQLAKGGVGGEDGWLSAPNGRFVIDYLLYLHHYSFVAIGVTLVVGIITWSTRPISPSKKAIWIGLSLFSITFLLTYFYSLYINPVIQYSILIFVHYWLYYILFATADLKTKPYLVFLTLIISVHLITLETNREYFTTYQSTPYQAILIDGQKTPDIPHLVDADITNFNYEVEEHSNKPFQFVFIRDFKENQFFLYLDSVAKKETSIYLGAMYFNHPTIIARILHYYPNYQKTDYFGATTYTFKKGNANQFLSLIENATMDSIEFGNRFPIIPGAHVQDNIDFRLDLILKDNSQHELYIVTEVKNGDSLIQWEASNLKDTYLPNQEIQTLIHSLQLTEGNFDADYSYSTYLWNPKKIPFEIISFGYQHREGNRKVFGRIHDF